MSATILFERGLRILPNKTPNKKSFVATSAYLAVEPTLLFYGF